MGGSLPPRLGFSLQINNNEQSIQLFQVWGLWIVSGSPVTEKPKDSAQPLVTPLSGWVGQLRPTILCKLCQLQSPVTNFLPPEPSPEEGGGGNSLFFGLVSRQNVESGRLTHLGFGICQGHEPNRLLTCPDNLSEPAFHRSFPLTCV